MSALILPSRRAYLPNGPITLDRTSTFFTGIRYFVITRAPYYNVNLVDNSLLTVTVETYATINHDFAQTYDFALGGTAGQIQYTLSKSSWVGSYAVSHDQNGSGNVPWMFASTTAWDGLYADNAGNLALTSNSGFGGGVNPGVSYADGPWQRNCISVVAANNFRGARNASDVAVDTSAALPITNLSKLVLGGDYSQSNQTSSRTQYFSIWDRVLSDAEMRAFNADPWQMVVRRPRILYFTSAGGGGATITGDSGSYTLTGTAATLKAGRKLAADSGTYNLTGTAAALKVGRKLTADSGTYTLTGTAVAFKRGYALGAESGTYTVSGTSVNLKAGRKLTADSGSYALTGTDVTLNYSPAGSYNLTAESGTYTLTGTAATLKVSRKLTADSGTYALTGTAAGLAKGVRLTAESGSYTLTGSNVAFARTYVLTAESGAYTLTGTSAGLTWSGAPVVEVPTNGGPSIYGKPVFREKQFRKEYEEQVKRIEDEKRLARILREDEEIICIMALMAA